MENQTCFQASTVHLINQFLESQEKPICLVAHNGNRFDFPILKTEIHRTGEQLLDDVLCIDSLEAFRNLHKQSYDETTVQESETTSTATVPLEFQDGFDQLLCEIADEMEGKKTMKRVEEVRKVNETTPQKQIMVRRDLFASTSTDSVENTAVVRTRNMSKTVVRKLKFG